ncbi:42113_t:CDS:1, partial [Gigaspora margarita]
MPPRRTKVNPRKPTKPPIVHTRSRVNRTGKNFWINEFEQRINLERQRSRFPGKDKKFFDDEIEKIKSGSDLLTMR